MYAVKGVMEKGKVWLERHKWFYGWEVNKNQERGKGWDECTRDGVIWRKGGGGMGGGVTRGKCGAILDFPSGEEWKGAKGGSLWLGRSISPFSTSYPFSRDGVIWVRAAEWKWKEAIGGSVDLSDSPFLISLNGNLLPLFSLFIVSQQDIQLCNWMSYFAAVYSCHKSTIWCRDGSFDGQNFWHANSMLALDWGYGSTVNPLWIHCGSTVDRTVEQQISQIGRCRPRSLLFVTVAICLMLSHHRENLNNILALTYSGQNENERVRLPVPVFPPLQPARDKRR